jgi:cell division protein FtsB
VNSTGKSFRSSRYVLCVEASIFAMPIRQIIVVFYLVLFLSFGAGSAMFFWQTRQEYNQLRQVELATQRRLLEAEVRLREQESMLRRLRTDPAYVEMKIRQRLGYARPEEFIFRFEQ